MGLQRHSSTALAISKVRLMIVSPGHNRKKDIMRYKSKHNLLRWFIEDQRTLPASYVKSCQKFFDELQAPSHKLQAPGSKDLGVTTSGKPEFDHDWLDKSIIND